jgi:hypothetical protein
MEKLVDITLYISSTLGLITSLILATFGCLSFPFPLTGFAASFSNVAIFGLIPIAVIFVIRYNQLTFDLSRREIENIRYTGCPKWMQLTATILMAIGAFLFFLPGIYELLGYLPKNDGTSFPSTVLGGFGMIVYPSFIMQLYAINIWLTRRSRGTAEKRGSPSILR